MYIFVGSSLLNPLHQQGPFAGLGPTCPMGVGQLVALVVLGDVS
jgi:hypothetical protein